MIGGGFQLMQKMQQLKGECMKVKLLTNLDGKYTGVKGSEIEIDAKDYARLLDKKVIAPIPKKESKTKKADAPAGE